MAIYPDITVPEEASELMRVLMDTSKPNMEVLKIVQRMIWEAPGSVVTAEEWAQWPCPVNNWWIDGSILAHGTNWRPLVAMLPWIVGDVSPLDCFLT